MKFSSLSSIAAVLSFLPAALPADPFPLWNCVGTDQACVSKYSADMTAWGESFGIDYAKCNAIQPPGSPDYVACYVSASTSWLKENNSTVVEDTDVTTPTDPSEEDVNLEDESSSSMLRSTTNIAAAISMVTAATVLVLA